MIRDLLGRTLAGKYRLLDVQASGAFGVVFRAEQLFCGHVVRRVAVKVSRQTGLTEADAPVLFGDALILARLLAGGDHAGRQHLVPIYDLGLLPEHDGRGFLVMEYVDGFPLLAHIRAAGRVGVAAGLRYVKETCRALALVHVQGAVHRDLKPDNVLLDRRGVVRVVDFGLAAFVQPEAGFAPGPLGTFAYMAPETMRGRSTPASDVYGLGLLTYELFTGGGPHLTAPWSTGEDGRDDNLRLKESLHFPPPSGLHNEIRNDFRWLDAVVLRCLEADPSRRFADAGQLLEALEASGEVVEREGPPSTSHAPRATNDELIREARRLLAGRQYEQAIDRLDVHRPPEWAVLGADCGRVLRLLGQAYLGKGELAAARDCLEQLRTAQDEQALLAPPEYAAALSDLVKCYRGLGRADLADACQAEARRLSEPEA